MKTCRVEDDLVRELGTLSNQLNTLSSTWVHDEHEREEIQKRREILQAEIKQHRSKGHDGKRCPSFDARRAALYTPH